MRFLVLLFIASPAMAMDLNTYMKHMRNIQNGTAAFAEAAGGRGVYAAPVAEPSRDADPSFAESIDRQSALIEQRRLLMIQQQMIHQNQMMEYQRQMEAWGRK